MQEHQFELLTDGVPYMVKVIPFDFNSGTRYRVSYNGGRENIFVWDADLKRLRAIDDEASTVPVNLDIAISEKLKPGNY